MSFEILVIITLIVYWGLSILDNDMTSEKWENDKGYKKWLKGFIIVFEKIVFVFILFLLFYAVTKGKMKVEH